MSLALKANHIGEIQIGAPPRLQARHQALGGKIGSNCIFAFNYALLGFFFTSFLSSYLSQLALFLLAFGSTLLRMSQLS